MATPQCHPSPSSERDVGAIIPDAILLEQCRTCRKKDGVNGIKLRACTPPDCETVDWKLKHKAEHKRTG
ncbi:hypothetical protein BD311DRAFT_811133 [Dichomitus squalens]|uniref:MYND-type domain-containing protein n=1 Tax=Dichomitus squalens TaxID=114155 RepID=A0A4Q9MB00_9APHY|nr:hypothetical protein BD311DRAFT_811133 [Dichomitus squalens]